MFKYNIGDTVLYKGKKEWIIGRMYTEKTDNICIEYKLSLEHENVKEDELEELPNYSVEIKDKNGILIQKIDCDKIFGLSDISELYCNQDEIYVDGEKVDSICIEYKLSLENENVKEDELKELPNYSVEIKDENGILIQKIDCDKIFKLSNISELRCTLDETYVNGEKVDYLIGVKF